MSDRVRNRVRAALPYACAGMIVAGAGLAQPLDSDRPGIEYYPPWMVESNPWIAGEDQDYQPWEDGRFDRMDPGFFEWRDEQRRLYGPDWRSRPGVEEEYRRWRDTRD